MISSRNAGVQISGFSSWMVLIRSQPNARCRLSSRMMYSNCSPMPTILFCRFSASIIAKPGVEEDAFHDHVVADEVVDEALDVGACPRW